MKISQINIRALKDEIEKLSIYKVREYSIVDIIPEIEFKLVQGGTEINELEIMLTSVEVIIEDLKNGTITMWTIKDVESLTVDNHMEGQKWR